MSAKGSTTCGFLNHVSLCPGIEKSLKSVVGVSQLVARMVVVDTLEYFGPSISYEVEECEAPHDHVPQVQC